MFKHIRTTLILVILFVLSTAYAGQTPKSLAGAELVDALAVKELAVGGALIVDPRTKMEYSEEHIRFTHQGKVFEAIYLRFKDRSTNSVDFDLAKDKIKLFTIEKATAGDKSKAMIFYCNGSSCWKSYKVVRHLKAAGYKKLYWFRGGLPAWKAKGFGTSK
ncbi:MAG: rhodanese [Bdellovibrionales bacterium]|nr:rhodanese [Bdellovibrionales bacterium]MBT3526613.1 rhodanese [Bdellovibrionales bacterium]MBT7669707.1 rhodanese [Bdellovibrionales bacterium]MBT7766729.1 rhodanese [Bdellovibrionales bacterium]